MAQTLQQRAQLLKQQKCAVKGCTKNRHNIDPLCSAHEKRKDRYGHPQGKPIRQKEYEPELKEVTAFLDEHRDHPAIKAACEFFQKWLDAAGTKEAEVGQYIFGRLHGRLIQPIDILAEVSAVWLYSERNLHQLPDDMRLTFCLARNAARLVPWERRTYVTGNSTSQATRHPNPNELKATGERIRQVLARYFINLVHGLKAKEAQAQQFKEDLAAPFV